MKKSLFAVDYVTPAVETIEIEMERAFADSGHVGGGDINDFWPGTDDDYDLDY